jgi:Tol biopolymer transport system component
MTEQDVFEARLHAALQRHVAQATSDLDPVAFAHVVATKEPRRPARWLAWPRGAVPLGRLGWLLLAALLLAIIAGIVGVGAIRRLPVPFGLARPGLIAFGTGDNHIVLADADGSHPRDISGAAGSDYLPSWSPDGTKLAIWRAMGERFSIAVTDPDGVLITLIPTLEPVPRDHLTAWAGGAGGPLAWSPDSRHMAFWSWVGDVPQIFAVASDGTGLQRIGDPRIPAIDPVWSPDGSQIAFAGMGDAFTDSGAGPDQTGIFVMDADGSAVHRISHVKGRDLSVSYHEPQWQPGGDLIAYQADPDYDSHVFVARADGTAERDVSIEAGGTYQHDDAPTWSPDGRQLAFTRAKNAGPLSQIVIIDADGIHARELVHPPVDAMGPTWSPDGTRVLGYLYDPATASHTGLVDVDVAGTRPARTIPLVTELQARWQRLGP